MQKAFDNIFRKVIIFVCILAVATAIFLVLAGTKESYSVLYINPDTYSNYVNGTNVSFVYGVQSFEGKKTKYDLEIFLGNRSIETRQFEMEKGRREWNATIQIPDDIEYPTKVRLILKANNEEDAKEIVTNMCNDLRIFNPVTQNLNIINVKKL